MKYVIEKQKKLHSVGRWDIDYHLPLEGILNYPQDSLKFISEVADIVPERRDPTHKPEKTFKYVDISSIDVDSGVIISPQELLGKEAPSRARKVIREGDLIISTCRPTRGAIAVIPKELDNQICSTGFSVIRPKEKIASHFLHFVLRLEGTMEQFRKFSTGSSYPAILDTDVEKTLVPMANECVQNKISKHLLKNRKKRLLELERLNLKHREGLDLVDGSLQSGEFGSIPE